MVCGFIGPLSIETNVKTFPFTPYRKTRPGFCIHVLVLWLPYFGQRWKWENEWMEHASKIMQTKVARHRGESEKRSSKNPAPRCKAERQSLELARERERVSKVEGLMLSGLLSGRRAVCSVHVQSQSGPSFLSFFLTSSPSLRCRRRKLFRILPRAGGN